MTLNLNQFPKKIFDDVWLARVFIKKRPKETVIALTADCVEGMQLQEGSFICKIKRLTDAYSEEELLLSFTKSTYYESFPMTAILPPGNGFDDGNAVYIQLKPFDLQKWFKSRKSKGLEALVSYEEEESEEVVL